jgi:hypothetical protein
MRQTRRSPAKRCLQYAQLLCIAVASAWLGFVAAAASGAWGGPPAPALPPGSRGPPATARPPALTGARPLELTRLLPQDAPAMVWESVTLTGHPPLVCRSDTNGAPDFEGKDVPPQVRRPAFFFPDGARAYSPLDFVTKTSDAIKDVVLAIMGSPGQPWQDGGSGGMMCRASAVTAPYWCFSSLRAFNRGRVLMVDAGWTAAGYYALLSSSAAAGGAEGWLAIVVDAQPECGMWARTARDASGLQERISVVTALPWEETGGTVDVPARTACTGTSTQGGWLPTPADEVRQSYTAQYNGSHAHEEALAVPVVDLLSVVRHHAPPLRGDAAMPDALVLLLKIDARGYEAKVLAGVRPLIAAGRVLNMLVRVNKQHSAAALGLRSAVDARTAWAAGRQTPQTTGLLDAAMGHEGLGEDRGCKIGEEDNEMVSAHLVEQIVRPLLAAGFEMLVADRGWWAAQDPFRPPERRADGEWRKGTEPGNERTHDGATLESWSRALNRRGEVDLWFYLRADAGGTRLPP